MTVSSEHQRSSDPAATIDAVPRVVAPISAGNEDKKSVAENASEFHSVLSTPPQRTEKGRKRKLDILNEKTELNKQPTKKKCRVKVADDKFSLKTKKINVKMPKPVKLKRAVSEKDSQDKRKYVRKKKEHPSVAVRPQEAANDVVGREVVVSAEILSDSAKDEEFKGACRRALEFNDENSTDMTNFTTQAVEVSPKLPSHEDEKLSDKAVEPPLFLERKLINSEDDEGYISSDRLLNLAELKDSGGPSGELDYEDVNTISETVAMSEPDTEMELKALESLKLESDSLKKNTSKVIVYVRKKKTQPPINILHNIARLVPPSAEEAKVSKSEYVVGTVSGGTMLDSAGQENITSSSRKEFNLRVENASFISQANTNKTNAVFSSNSKNEYLQEMLHIPLVSNGRKMRACQCIQVMRKCKLNILKIKKQRRKIRKRRVDVSVLLPFQTLKQVWSEEPISLYQKVIIATKKQRSKGVTRRREFSSLLTVPQFDKSAADTLEEPCSLQVPQIDAWPTHDSLVTMSEGTSPSREEVVRVRTQEVDHNEDPIAKCFGPLFTINEHLFASDMTDDSGSAVRNYEPLQSDSALETGLDYMNALSCQQLYNNLHSWGPWVHECLKCTATCAYLTAEANNYSVNKHIPYCEPSTVNGQELVARVDNSLDVTNDSGNRELVTSMKKKKVIPHVNFDSKTMPMWRALMGIGDSRDHQCNEDEESKRWWQEERCIFKGKVQAFISCMHKIQGNRRFSQWNGSVLDSVMGVFLTQNVSDHLSSSAYMSLAAKYPVGQAHTQKAVQEEYIVIGASQESYGSNEAVLVSQRKLLDQETLNDRLFDGEQTAPLQDSIRSDKKNEFAENNLVKDDSAMPTVGLSGFEEWLSLQERMTQPQDSFNSKLETNERLTQKELATLFLNSETEELLSQGEHRTQPDHSTNPKAESEEFISLQQKKKTRPQHSPLAKSEREELLSHKPDPMMHSQDSSLRKSETDELLSHQQEQRRQRQDSAHPKVQKNKTPEIDWLKIKRKYCKESREINKGHTDSVDWDAVRRAPVEEVAETIKKRGQHNILAASMQNALNRIFSELGSLDLEWLRDTPPDVTKDFLLSIEGLGLKSVECIRLLALEQVAFPVDTNVGRIAVRLGWVDLKDVPEGLQFHLYPLMDAIQKYLWPRLCELDQLTLYELHYQMITFGKVFCKKRSPYCNACPLRASCKYFASAYVSARLPITDDADAGSSPSLPLIGPSSTQSQTTNHEPIVEMPMSPEPYIAIHTSLEPRIDMPTSQQLCTDMHTSQQPYSDMHSSLQPFTEMPTSPKPYREMPTSPQLYTGMPTPPQPYIEMPSPQQPYIEMPSPPEEHCLEMLEPRESLPKIPETMNPIVEIPITPESEHGDTIGDIEDLYSDVPEIPTIVLNDEEFIANVSEYIDRKKFQMGAEISNALVVSAQSARIPARKLKNIKDLRTEHLVYEIPDYHPLLRLHGLEKRDPNDPCLYLLSIWSPDESATLSSQTVKTNSNGVAEKPNSEEKCSDNCRCQQHNVDHVLGTFMIPCRTAMQGRFPLNGTYFQVNEVFADDESSHHPIKIPRSFLWNLNKCVVYCGSSASAITTGLTTEEIQVCFWRDYLCVRGFNRRTREPKELVERLHKLKTAGQTKRASVTEQGKPK